jgi:hypothetical protein
MCEHGTDVIVSVKIPADLSCEGQEKWKNVGIDACIAPLVAALQAGGIDMRGSCCGHGIGSGYIDLQDGRVLLILSTEENVFLTREPVDTVKYPCGCSASGPNVPKWCPEHGAPQDVVCDHGTAMDVHCCNCHSGFLFDSDSCVCALETSPSETPATQAVSTGTRSMLSPTAPWASVVYP